MIVLEYVLEGAYISGVPATDLTQEQIDESGFTIEQLLAYTSGGEPVYVRAEVSNGK